MCVLFIYMYILINLFIYFKLPLQWLVHVAQDSVVVSHLNIFPTWIFFSLEYFSHGWVSKSIQISNINFRKKKKN